MPVKINVTANEIRGLESEILTLVLGNRCSRCDRSPADFFEVHRLKYRVGYKQFKLSGNKFDVSKDYSVKIGICETCYQSDFLTHPDLLDRNGSKLAKISQFHSVLWTLGGAFAAIGFLLFTPIVPDSAFFTPLKELWQVPVGCGLLILLLNWLSQRKYQSQTLHELEKVNPHFTALPRAEVRGYILDSEKDLSVTALEIVMQNDAWAKEIAEQHQWTCEPESIESNQKKE
mgnify:CR=1 FL=1